MIRDTMLYESELRCTKLHSQLLVKPWILSMYQIRAGAGQEIRNSPTYVMLLRAAVRLCSG